MIPFGRAQAPKRPEIKHRSDGVSRAAANLRHINAHNCKVPTLHMDT